MQIVLGVSRLDAGGERETYAVTVGEALQRLGHDVVLLTDEVSEAAEEAEERGIRVVPAGVGAPGRCDVCFAQDAASAYELGERFAGAVHAFAVHPASAALSTPPSLPGLVSGVVAMSDDAAQAARASGARPEVLRLRRPVDTVRLSPLGPPHDRARRVLCFADDLGRHVRAMLGDACRAAALELEVIPSAGSRSGDPKAARESAVTAVARADVVVARGHRVLEAMACGRAAYVLGEAAGGWVSVEDHGTLEARGFRGAEPPSQRALAEALGAYGGDMGAVNRRLAVERHGVDEHAAALVELFARLGAGADTGGAPLREMSRLVRLWSQAEAGRDAAREDAKRLRDERRELAEKLGRERTKRAVLERRVAELGGASGRFARRVRGLRARGRPQPPR